MKMTSFMSRTEGCHSTGQLYLTAFLMLMSGANAVEQTRMNAGMATEMQNAFPTGPGSAGLGALATYVLSKTIGLAEFNLNADFELAAFRTGEGREFLYRIGLGADYPLDFGQVTVIRKFAHPTFIRAFYFEYLPMSRGLDLFRVRYY